MADLARAAQLTRAHALGRINDRERTALSLASTSPQSSQTVVKKPGNNSTPKPPKPVINARVKVGRAQAGATIIGVQHGPTQQQVDAAVERTINSLLAQHRLTVPAVESGDIVTRSLFICRSSTGGDTLGFAVNNSGLIVCPTAIGEADTVEHIASKATYQPRYILKRNLLSALTIDNTTAGLLPSYREFPDVGEVLFSYDREGNRVAVTVDAFALDNVRVLTPDGQIILYNTISAWFDPAQKPIGGPVLSQANEVVGIAVAFGTYLPDGRGFLIVQPWSTVEKCIEMQAELRK
jgi:hypothetical protein